MRPGVNVSVRDSAPPSSTPTDVGTCFMVGVTEAGPSTSTADDLVQNMEEYQRKFAPSGRAYAAAITMWDSVEAFFAEGGNRLYIGRVFGPAAALATVNLLDNVSAIALVVKARGVGDYGNSIDIVVRTNTQDPDIPVGSYRLRLVNEVTSEVLDESYDLATNADAVQWAFSNSFVSITSGVSAIDPVAGTFDLAGGVADTAGITDVQWSAALASLSRTLGPGVVCAPGATTNTIHNYLAEAAHRDLRIAFLDGPDTATVSTLTASAKAVVDDTLKRARFAGMFGPWATVPGLTTASVRKVPPSPIVAGVFARNMANGLSANEPAAGENGRFNTVLGFSQTYTDVDRETLNANGFNVLRDIYGVRKVYGWRTTADPVNDPRWIGLNNSILHRQIVALAGVIGERFVFRQIDGQGRLISEFNGALVGEICLPLFLDGSLYGATAEEAYKVDTGPSVNTIATVANSELRAVISIKMAPFGEEVNIEIVKYLVTESIPV